VTIKLKSPKKTTAIERFKKVLILSRFKLHKNSQNPIKNLIQSKFKNQINACGNVMVVDSGQSKFTVLNAVRTLCATFASKRKNTLTSLIYKSQKRKFALSYVVNTNLA
jgi:hypothetical protein